MTSRDRRRRLERIMQRHGGKLPELTDELGATLIEEWDQLTFLDGRGKARIDGAPVGWNRAAFVYIPSRDAIYRTEPRGLWSAGLAGEKALDMYENPLYHDESDELPS